MRQSARCELSAVCRTTKEKTNSRIPFSHCRATRMGLRRVSKVAFGSEAAMRFCAGSAINGSAAGMDSGPCGNGELPEERGDRAESGVAGGVCGVAWRICAASELDGETN